MSLAVACLGLLVAAAMRRSLPLATADSLLYGLISTEHLTVFYWGQDRLANLVPALAWPVQQITWNYLLQSALIAASYFALIGVFAWFHASRSHRPMSLAVVVAGAAIASALSLMLLTAHGVYTFVLEQQYALSTLLFLLGLGGLAGDGARRRALGAAGILVATLVIPSSVLLLPAIVVVGRGPGIIRRSVTAAVVSGVAFGIGTIASQTLSDGFPLSDTYSDFSPSRLRVGVEQVANNIADSTQKWAVVAAAVVCVAVLVARRHTFDRTLQVAYLLCPLFAAGWVVLFSANAWVEINLYLYRYFFPAYAAGLMILVGATTEVCALVASSRPWRTPHPAGRARIIAPAIAVVAMAISGLVVAATDVPALDAGDRLAELASAQGTEIVVGDYWQAWPAMFAARADGDSLLVASLRSDPLRGDIVAVADRGRTVSVLCLDPAQDRCLDELATVTATPWELVSVRSTAPLVLDVAISR